MGPSIKHWPSMFKRPNYQNSERDIKYSSLTGGHDEERTSKPPRPRWTPRPEQIQILERIFNSGMMNPPREDIKKIRQQLQEYGPVGDINIFYWFQNRKARKHKQTQPNNMNPRKRKTKNSQNASSSSSSPHQNASSNEIVVPNNIEFPTNNGVVNLTNDSPNDTIFGDENLAIDDYFHTPIETDFQLSTPPWFSFPGQFTNMTQQYDQDQEVAMNMMHHHQQQQDPQLMSSGVTPSSLYDDDDHSALPPLPPIIIDAPGQFSNMTQQYDQYDQGNIQDLEVAMNMVHQQQQQQLMSSGVTSNSLNDDDSALPPLPPIIIDAPVADPFPITQFQGVGEPDHFRAKCTVSINNEIIEVDAGPFNIRQIFGDGAILVDSSGHLVLTDEWGVTLESLQHGASYFLV